MKIDPLHGTAALLCYAPGLLWLALFVACRQRAAG